MVEKIGDMKKVCIRIRPIKTFSEARNMRLGKLGFVKEDLTKDNSQFIEKTIAQAKVDIAINYFKSTGLKIAHKSIPLRECTVPIEIYHNANHIKQIARTIYKRFGIRIIQGYCHKDEGHFDELSNRWEPDYHAHLIFDWSDEVTGKTIKMDGNDLLELQSIITKGLESKPLQYGLNPQESIMYFQALAG